MYSVVLMMALTGGADATAFGHKNNCGGGGYGCYGNVGYAVGCTGGYGGYGCYGGGCGGRHHGHHRNRCCGTVNYGCTGCYGNVGCVGGYGYGNVGCVGGYGYGNVGCVGGYPGFVGGGAGGVITSPAPTVAPPVAPPVEDKKKAELQNAPATIVVQVPAGASVTVDGTATASTSSVRTFVSPALERGFEYTYTLRAEMTRDGATQVATEVVTVRAGEQTRVNLSFADTSVVSR